MSFAMNPSSAINRMFTPALDIARQRDFHSTDLASRRIEFTSTENKKCEDKKAVFDEKSLYQDGSPKPSDIRQDNLGDCYFVSTIGSLAQQDPQAIQDAISYDPSTQSFNVTMYQKEFQLWPLPHTVTKPVTVNVTQEELAYNLERNGGSTVDNDPCNNGATWPMVMETAYAKMHDSNPADGLQEGFDKIGNGGWPGNAMFTVTGKDSHTVSVDEGLIALYPTTRRKHDAIYQRVNDALQSGKPVTLSVKEESSPDKQDNLMDNHAYMVTDIRQDKNGEVWVKIRNPWGNNKDGEGTDSPDAEIEVKLSDLDSNGTISGTGSWGFEVGG